MRKSSCICAMLLAMTLVCVSDLVAAETPGKANELFQSGMGLIKEGKLNEGLGMLKQASEAEPTRADLHMNYGSMLFVIGAQIYQKGNAEGAAPIFQEAERQLLWATEMFTKKEEGTLKAQCYYVLGDISLHVKQDKEKAKGFYQKALVCYPQHGGAIEALKGIK